MNNRYDFLYLFDCTDANPNGDPDAGNLPRLDPETGQGLATDVMLKRKIRNFVQLTKEGEPGHDIYIKEKAILNNQHARAYTALKKDPKKAKQPDRDEAKEWMCKNFYDIRTFGAVMTTDVNCGQVRGPAQLSFARSIDRIVTAEHAVTRMAVTTEKEAEKQSGDNRTMGRKFTIPYGLYKAQGFINPFLAEQTGFSDDDLELLFTALENAFQFDQSAARPAGSMAPRALLVFKHDSKLGNAPSHKLFEAVTVEKRKDVEVPRSFNDYDVTIDESAIPEGVSLIKRI
jgi:CRISPR-associated protein Csd2